MSFNSFSIMLADAAAPVTATPAASTGTAAATTPASGPPTILQIVPFILMFVVLYLLVMRPQSKKVKEHAALISTLKPGDKVVTSGGVIGTIVSVKDKTVAIRSVETKMEVLKSAVSEVIERSGESNAGES